MKRIFAAAFRKRLFFPVRRIFGEVRFRKDVAAILARQRGRYAILKQLKDEGVSEDHFTEAVGCQTRMIKVDTLQLIRAHLAAYRAGVSADRVNEIQSEQGGEPDFTLFGITLDEPRYSWPLEQTIPDFSASFPPLGWDFDSSR